MPSPVDGEPWLRVRTLPGGSAPVTALSSGEAEGCVSRSGREYKESHSATGCGPIAGRGSDRDYLRDGARAFRVQLGGHSGHRGDCEMQLHREHCPRWFTGAV